MMFLGLLFGRGRVCRGVKVFEISSNVVMGFVRLGSVYFVFGLIGWVEVFVRRGR